MKREEKEQIVAEVSETARKAHGMFFTDFTGLTVEQATELRREFYRAGVEYRVVKNTLIQKALEQVTGYDSVFDRLAGPTGVAFAFEDPVVPARIIQKFTEKHSRLSLKVCVLEHQVFEGARLAELAKLPSRREIMSSILGCVQSPLAGVPTVIAALMRDIASIVDEIGKKKAA
ncbi:MAG TPA: 50S ribosomal protein L10 [Bacteroidota bacterium]|nr:50S ribosomal protein L10 [Bacteroidota bacterium]